MPMLILNMKNTNNNKIIKIIQKNIKITQTIVMKITPKIINNMKMVMVMVIINSITMIIITTIIMLLMIITIYKMEQKIKYQVTTFLDNTYTFYPIIQKITYGLNKKN